jgi:rhodanese-related sulfurtransferase
MFKMVALALFATVAVAQQIPPASAGASATTHQAPASKAKKLGRADLDALLAHPDQILLIDVRRPDEIALIGGFAVYLNVQIGDLKNQLAFIPRDRTIITVSNHAARAGAAADLLIANGFHVAGAVGAQLYEADGGTLVKFAPPKPGVNVTASAN